MATPRMTQARSWDPDGGENPFTWIVEETERLRFHDQRRFEASRPRPQPVLRSLDCGHTVLLNKADEPGLQKPRENVFEVSKARKL